MAGETLLFARADEVEAQWAIVEPILGKDYALFDYEPESWGPTKADVLLSHLGGWHEPKAGPASKPRFA
jgi:glucose-6-phosphate 1-dehydrogenase